MDAKEILQIAQEMGLEIEISGIDNYIIEIDNNKKNSCKRTSHRYI